MKETVQIVAILLLVLVLLAVMPVALVWSVNTLFGLSIPYNLKSIVAAWVLLFVIRVATRTEVNNEALRR